ncbi:TFIIIC transcription initiation factor complex subunits Tfc3 [Beauveria brongniartii RCEF 3172]|uniref:TFIIIC transcription initiation factor complex subunits Tfc3 n=1 Tax=Beauveria brongniartii RCEF 3172 TaxID=1081107 RepID=A0A167FGQ8_9HYPO|nr:TFIIIC transcription initiation factor complex subunits Tfc3 [Beauveria brongniartii RCEF 3172]
MWESLAGHGVDHKRIPRSEWILLQGIASTKTNGILQGDLGRLVGQDKRSVPKRTSCLVEKGYITKRTTLVRGTKTSKLWLRFLAPSISDESNERSEAETDITLSRQCLVESLEPVPWHMRWTGDSIDYKVLATTIMAICKEWNVMRLQDLKSKLGVLGMAWQMKVISKICRFLNARGTIQYVAAKLNNRIFKDCIRFNREMNARDWSIFLATGKRTTKSWKNATQELGEDESSMLGMLKSAPGLGEAHCPSWCIYIPITSLVALCIQESGSNGLTNPQLCAMTIGPSFTRYLAGLTASISTDNIQPSNTEHLTVKSERGRPGKSSSLYWYTMPNLEIHPDSTLSQRTSQLSRKLQKHHHGSSEPYNFESLDLEDSNTVRVSTLSDLCQRGLSQQKRRGRPKKMNPEQSNGLRNRAPRESTSVQTSTKRKTRGAAAESIDIGGQGDAGSIGEGAESENHEESLQIDNLDEVADNEAPEPKTRVRGRPKTRDGSQASKKSTKAKAQAPGNRQFRCEKCDGTWKNDVGLKYHLEKSQTPCNPSFKPQLMPAPKNPSLATGRRRVPPARKLPIKANTGYISNLSTTDKRVRNEAVDEDVMHERGDYSGLATPPVRMKHVRSSELADVNEDVSILSGQAELLTVLSALPPRQVDPFAKHSARQSVGHRSVEGITEDLGASASLPHFQKAILEVPEARPSALTLAPQVSTSPAESMKEALETPRKKNPLRNKLMNIILGLLNQYSGVLPAGQSLEILVSEHWKLQQCEGDVPSGAKIKSVMLQMIREKKIVDQWHAFRASDGRIGKCQIITSPSVMAFAPETRALVEAIRQLYPANILPHQMPGDPCDANEAENLEEEEEDSNMAKSFRQDSKVGGRGRRSLAAGVATLSAPVYVAQITAQITAKRAADSGEIPSPPGKRRRVVEKASHAVDEYQGQHFWPVADVSPPAHDIQQVSPSACAGITLDICFNDVGEDGHGIIGIQAPLWARDSVTRPFERLAGSMRQNGWIAGSRWFSWTSHYRVPYQTPSTAHQDRSHFDYFVEKLRMCLTIEMENEYIEQLPTEKHNIFINFLGGDAGNHVRAHRIQWHKSDKGQSTAPEVVVIKVDEDEMVSSSVSADEEPEPPSAAAHDHSGLISASTPLMTPPVTRRAALTSRSLTSLTLDTKERRMTAELQTGPDSDELLAAFVAIRSLLGGIDKVIDWGLLARLFPVVGLAALRRFWARIRKEKASTILKATQDFQDRFIAAVEADEMAIPDYERPLDYDWKGLIQWTMRQPNQEQLYLPSSRERFQHEFKLEDGSKDTEDWKDKFYHPQSSMYSRFETASLQPGSLTGTEVKMSKLQPALDTIDIARSWIRSLCCTSETDYTPQDVKQRFSMLSKDTPQRNTLVLKAAIDQLTKERVICKSKRAPFGGRPYRLNEAYTSVLAKVAHRQKYLDAVSFKKGLDQAFQNSSAMKVPYTLSDGAMMALTNLIAHERIRVTATNVPNIPFGFEPGNYESRKYPKSYYHMDLEVQPTPSYLFNGDVGILEVVQGVGPPREGRTREIPQWVDFFGKLDEQRWADILGAVCFAFNTRGTTSVTGICEAVAPILEVFEAELIISWGLKTGLFTRATQHSGITLGEWWWLVVVHRWS